MGDRFGPIPRERTLRNRLTPDAGHGPLARSGAEWSRSGLLRPPAAGRPPESGGRSDRAELPPGRRRGLARRLRWRGPAHRPRPTDPPRRTPAAHRRGGSLRPRRAPPGRRLRRTSLYRVETGKELRSAPVECRLCIRRRAGPRTEDRRPLRVQWRRPGAGGAGRGGGLRRRAGSGLL